MINCENCKQCVFSDGHGSPNRYYCSHKENPDRISGIGGFTLICKTERHSKEFTIKKTPRWCPMKNN